MSYVLITPLKNEEGNLSKLKDSIFNQTNKPVRWVIVDSGSEDFTYSRSQDIFGEYDWIQIIKQKKFFEKGYGHLNFSEAINEGYASLKEICHKENISYNYVGKTDATPILCNNYYEILMSEMDNNNKLAITCGVSKFIHNNSEINIGPYKRIPQTGFNDIRLYRKDFFENNGGYPLTPSPDSVLLVKAINKNLEVKVFTDVYFFEPRMSGSKVGVWNGSRMKGKYMYILGYHPILAFLNSLEISRRMPPHYQVIPLFWGYILSCIKREKKISDMEVRDYYGKKRLKEVLNIF
jgi:glycosyltransferase involved in cell wall biosynthesis